MSFLDGQYELKESQYLEFKEAAGGLPSDVWETYSAFANTEGGEIVLGVREDRATHAFTLVGAVNPDGIIDDIWNQINNPSCVGSNILLPDDVKKVSRDGFDFVVIEVPRAERDQKPVSVRDKKKKRDVAWVRRGTGDYEASENDVRLMQYDNAPRADRVPLDSFGVASLCDETIRRYRNVFAANKPHNPWNSDTDEDFLYHIGALAKGRTGKLVPTTAGLLAFGYEYEITQLLPGYLLDYREELGNGSRWDDRLVSQSGDWSGNLIDFYFMVSERLVRRFKMPFSTDELGMRHGSRNPVTEALNEVVANALAHAYYGADANVKIILRGDTFEATNSGSFLIDRDVAISGGFSVSRNPTLIKILSLIGASDRAGSGLNMVWMTWERLFSSMPNLEERHSPSFIRVSLPLDEGARFGMSASGVKDGAQNELLAFIAATPDGVTTAQISRAFPEISERVAQKRLKDLYDAGKLDRHKRGRSFYYNA